MTYFSVVPSPPPLNFFRGRGLTNINVMIHTHIFKLWQGALKLRSVCWLVCLSVLQKLQNFTEIYKTLQNSTKHYKTLQNNRIRSFGSPFYTRLSFSSRTCAVCSQEIFRNMNQNVKLFYSFLFKVQFKLHNQVSHTFQLKYETF